MEDLSIKKARTLLDEKQISAKELAEYFLKNIEKKNKELNVYLEVYDDVLDQVKEAQKIIDSGNAKNLTGIPLSLKDVLLVKGKKVTASSKILGNYRATYTSTAAKKLIEDGAVLLGRVNCDEFAMGGSTENSAFGPTRNPLDAERVAGGSSGGSAASVAADLALGSLGSDTGGSIRDPASFCGIVGLKPTYGRVSRYGLMALGSSLDCVGPMAKTVTDTEIIYDCIKGRDRMDSTSIDESIIAPKKTSKALPAGRQAKIGIPRHLLEMDGIAGDVKRNFEESVKKFESLGFEIIDVTLKNIDKSLAVYYIIMPAEASSNLARYDGIKYGLSLHGDESPALLDVYRNTKGEGFGPEPRRRIILGTYVLSSGYYDSYYGKALEARNAIKKEFEKAFEEVDLILTPTMSTPAWKVGEKSSPLETYLADIFTVTANIAKIPAISLPSGFSDIQGKKLPLGIQLMAPLMSEEILFKAGKTFLGETH